MCDASAGCTSGCTAPSDSDSVATDDGDDDDNDDADDDDNYLPEAYTPCDYYLTFDNLDDLNAASGGLRVECLAAYALDTLITMLDTAYDNYTSVNDGYDEEFGYYVTYIKKLVPSVLDTSFMFDKKKSTGGVPYPGLGMSCEYCTILTVADMPDTDCIHQLDFDCREDKKSSKTLPCTDDNNGKGSYSSYQKNFMTLRDEDGFNVALGNAGLAPDWIVLGEHTIKKTATHSLIDHSPPADDTYNYRFSGFPIENPDISVPNPKDLVTKGLGSIPELRLSMEATYMEITLGSYIGGNPMDAAEAFSTPVFMLMQAVDGMAQAKALGAQEEKEEEEEEKRRKNFIILILSVVLMVCDTLLVDHP